MSTYPDRRILGETAELGCIVVGLPESTVSWRHNGQPLMGERFQSFGDNGTLLIRDVRLEDNGMYECVAVNQLGEDQASVKLTVYGKLMTACIHNSGHPLGVHLVYVCILQVQISSLHHFEGA